KDHREVCRRLFSREPFNKRTGARNLHFGRILQLARDLRTCKVSGGISGRSSKDDWRALQPRHVCQRLEHTRSVLSLPTTGTVQPAGRGGLEIESGLDKHVDASEPLYVRRFLDHHQNIEPGSTWCVGRSRTTQVAYQKNRQEDGQEAAVGAWTFGC